MNKVLIVEDDPTIARIYQGLIRMEGYEGEVAKDGDAAIEYLASFRPNLVLLDLMLPKKNGIYVLKHIRANAALSELPVIVFTNAYMGTLMREAMLAGATHCVAKAKSSPKHVMQTIRGYLAVACSAGVEPLTPTAAAPTTDGTAAAPSGGGDSAPTGADAAAPLPVLQRATQLLGEMRGKLLALAKTEKNGGQMAHLISLRQTLGTLTSSADEGGFHAIHQMAKALEELAKELCTHPAKLDPSYLRAIAQSLDCVDGLVRRAARGEGETLKTSTVLVLDDDPTSRQTIAAAMERLGLRCIPLDDPTRAQGLLQTQSYDLIFLDADAPRFDGLQLCRKLREPGINQSAAVIFITSRTTLESRALSVMSGADDFIRKPLLGAELAVKGLLHILNPRTRPVPQPSNPNRPVLRMAPPTLIPAVPACAGSNN
ncbi:MAG: response regulator [Verrucomicrobiota bacterium]